MPSESESPCPVVLVIVCTQCRTNVKQYKLRMCVSFQSSLSSIIKDYIRGRTTEANQISAGVMQKVRGDNKQVDSSFANDSSVC